MSSEQGFRIDSTQPLIPQVEAAMVEIERLRIAGLLDAERALWNAVRAEIRRSLFKPADVAYRRIEEGMIELESYAFELGQHGWTIPMWGPIPLVREIFRHISTDQLDHFFVTAYRQQWHTRERRLFVDLLDAELLANWNPVIEQAIASYRRKRYLIVVPALLSVLEGALASAAQRSSDRTSPSRMAAEQRLARDAGAVRLGWVSLHGFVSSIFAHHSFDAAPPGRLNRHWVLHGRDSPRWDAVDCLRLFQALDTLAVVGRMAV
jgi:hypothetical protein